jgi:hypothetical protein
MIKVLHVFVILFLATAASILADPAPSPTPEPGTNNLLDKISIDSTYTLNSDFKNSRLGDGSSFFNDFTYDHRFLINGNWYFRAGVEYERFDFGGTDNGLPDHLQGAYTHLAVDYVVHDFPAASLEVDPGVYFQDRITGDAFDIPWKIYASFPLKKDKIFMIIGLGGGIHQSPPVAPGGGLIWIFSDKLRLQGVFPKPALIYEPYDNWEFRLLGELVYESFRTDDVITPLRKLQLHNAPVEYNEDRIGVQATYSGFKPFKISASTGYTIIRQFDFFDDSVRAKTEPAPYFNLSINARF